MDVLLLLIFVHLSLSRNENIIVWNVFISKDIFDRAKDGRPHCTVKKKKKKKRVFISKNIFSGTHWNESND